MFYETESRFQKQEKIDSFYSDIDVKIGLVKDLLLVSNSLPIPRFTQTPKKIQTENDALRSIEIKANHLFPEDFHRLRQLQRLYTLQENLEIPNFRGNKNFTRHKDLYLALDQQISSLEKHPGIIFLDSISYGIGNLILNRHELRKIQRAHNTKIDDYGWADNSKDYSVKGKKATRVLYGKFSLGLFFDPTAYSQITKSLTSRGVHQNGVITFIQHRYLSPEEDLLNSIFNNVNSSDFISDENLQTAAHEDAHVFIEGFRNLYSLSTIGYTEKPLIEDIKSEIDLYLEDGGNYQKARIKRRLKNAANLSSEELLAELFSEFDRTTIPQSTFKNIDKKTKDKIELAFKGSNQEVNQLIDDAHPKFNFEQTKNLIKSLYAQVAQYCPDKRLDLDIAFSLFPVSKISRIEKMVYKWIRETKAPLVKNPQEN